MHTSNIALLVLVASAAIGAFAAPLLARDATDVQVSSNVDLAYPRMIGNHVAARSEDSGAALNELSAREISVVKNKRKEMRDLRGSLGSRELIPRRDMQARDLASTVRIFFRFYKLMKGTIFRRDVIAPDLLAARDIVDNLSTESLNAREFITQQRGLQTRNAPEVSSETVARDTSSD